MPYWRVKDLGFTGISFPFRLDETGRVAVSTTDVKKGVADSLIEALRQLVLTAKGERFFNRSFGAKPLHILFSPNTEQTLTLWFSDLLELLRYWEPRVEVTKFEVVAVFESTAVVRIGFRPAMTMLEEFVEAEIPLHP